jgi:hypothetical protein
VNDHWNVLSQVTVFYADRKSKMAVIAGHRLTLDPMGKCSNAFILLALAAMLNTRLERKTLTLQRTIHGTFLLSLVPIGPVVSEKKLEM